MPYSASDKQKERTTLLIENDTPDTGLSPLVSVYYVSEKFTRLGYPVYLAAQPYFSNARLRIRTPLPEYVWRAPLHHNGLVFLVYKVINGYSQFLDQAINERDAYLTIAMPETAYSVKRIADMLRFRYGHINMNNFMTASLRAKHRYAPTDVLLRQVYSIQQSKHKICYTAHITAVVMSYVGTEFRLSYNNRDS